MDEFEFGIKTRLYNFHMREARERLGYSQRMLAEICNCSYGLINAAECLRTTPGIEIAKKISNILEVDIDILFPDWLKGLKPAYPPDRHLTYGQAKEMLGAGIDKVLLLDTVKECMTEQQYKVICFRFGLNGEETHTLHETGVIMGVTQERIRQLEACALRHLRHPSTARKLKDFLLE